MLPTHLIYLGLKQWNLHQGMQIIAVYTYLYIEVCKEKYFFECLFGFWIFLCYIYIVKIKVMKNSTRTLLYIALIYFLILLLASCTKQDTIYPSLCNGNCDTNYEITYKGLQIFPNSNGYYEIQWDGLNYFQIKGSLTELNDQYVNNGIPLVEANFDSDYWVVFDTLSFQTPMYSYLGWFNNQSLTTPISIGPHVYTMEDLIDLHPPHNIIGYQLPKHFCIECPYAETIIGTHSKYNYHPTQNVMLDNEMVGDTINIFIESIFNTEGGVTYYGHNNPAPKDIIEDQIKIIVI